MQDNFGAILFGSEDDFNGHYELSEKIGTGQFAVVKRCIDRSTRIQYASKFIRKKRYEFDKKGVSKLEIEREIRILAQCQKHENLVSFHGAYETTSNFILVLEMADGKDLYEWMLDTNLFNEFTAMQIIRKILNALHYLHCKNIVHLDLKPENIVCAFHPGGFVASLKLVDFGLSRKLLPGSDLKIIVGTPEFVAPEVINYDPVTPAADLWSLGVLTYLLLTGLSPFLDENKAHTLCRVSAGNFATDIEKFYKISRPAKDFIAKLLLVNPRQRLTCFECLQHPFVLENSKNSPTHAENLAKCMARKRWRVNFYANRNFRNFCNFPNILIIQYAETCRTLSDLLTNQKRVEK